jgi:hypothetical protein
MLPPSAQDDRLSACTGRSPPTGGGSLAEVADRDSACVTVVAGGGLLIPP